jgi:uncharacterized membrane protein
MNGRSVLKTIPLRVTVLPGLAPKIRFVLFALFLIQFTLVWWNLWSPFPGFGNARWPNGLLLMLTAATVLASLTCQLPLQNVMFASVIIAAVAGAVQTLGAMTAIPFGPYVYMDAIGQRLFEPLPLPWTVPFIWIIAISCARGVGRLILRPWRKTRSYGFWLMGLTVALIVLFDLGLEPFATQVKKFWFWAPTRAGIYWYSTPWVNFFAWAGTGLLILAFATPTLINKKPVSQPPDFHPLIIWLLVSLLFATGAIANRLWAAAAVIVAHSLITAIFAVRGAAW